MTPTQNAMTLAELSGLSNHHRPPPRSSCELETDMAIIYRQRCNDQRLEALARDELLLVLLRGV